MLLQDTSGKTHDVIEIERVKCDYCSKMVLMVANTDDGKFICECCLLSKAYLVIYK